MSQTTQITIIQRTEEEDLVFAQMVAAEAIKAYLQANQEHLIPKEKIKAAFGIKDDQTFYNLRRRKSVAAIEVWGNCPVYRLSDFLKPD